MMMGVIDAKHISRGVIDGVECDHLAFRNADVDWHLWVEIGSWVDRRTAHFYGEYREAQRQ